jgi:hypothetical protein
LRTNIYRFHRRDGVQADILAVAVLEEQLVTNATS